MTQGTARSVVLVCGGLLLAFVAAQPGPKFRRAWAAGLTTLGLSFLADVAPQVGGPAAILVLMAVAVRQRGQLGQLLGTTHPAAVAPAQPSTPGK